MRAHFLQCFATIFDNDSPPSRLYTNLVLPHLFIVLIHASIPAGLRSGVSVVYLLVDPERLNLLFRLERVERRVGSSVGAGPASRSITINKIYIFFQRLCRASSD